MKLWNLNLKIFILWIVSIPDCTPQEDYPALRNCTRFFNVVRRVGLNAIGRLNVPIRIIDEAEIMKTNVSTKAARRFGPIFQEGRVTLKFSSPLHHISVRQKLIRATETEGTRHREFNFNPISRSDQKFLRGNGNLVDLMVEMNAYMRLQTLFSQTPRLLRLAVDGQRICSEEEHDSLDSVVVQYPEGRRAEIF